MSTIEYLKLDDVDLTELMFTLNEDSLRSHLIDHPYFDEKSIRSWVEGKIDTDSMTGCKVRAVIIDGVLSGWCGIQPDECGFEVAIVISKKFWGSGVSIFRTLLLWAGQLGHKEVVFHLLDSRREYKSLAKKANRVRSSQLLGRRFNTYYFPVDSVG
ncbi:hypothetical protein ACQKPX_09815 [Photobacterium sp. DNB23_23_1]|uniref:GNAT family N-acetyltransferase n=1 Tax=Photobacterium pectinilyticum TaxID=2906793 RepID=A0ABT1MZ79_9GAMM|nr:hypothetical protein [Photobacterium sp. ZSDE20]MCQ1057817.1 hypothetical protein [Photobacterium sp. ZSDE20]MDD1822271.1 hypothetical protein [Photobacterium sp. ZSDE20]